MAILGRNPSIIYLAVDSGIAPYKYTLGGIYGSRDGARTWSRSTSWPTESAGVGSSLVSVAVDPRNPSEVAAAPYGGGVLRSSDGGADWTYWPLWASGSHDDRETWNVAYGAGPSFDLWAGTAAGAFKLRANGTWRRAGLSGRSVLVVPDARLPKVAFALLGQNGYGAPGVSRTDDGGRTWVAVRGLPSTVVGVSIQPRGDAVYAWTNHRVFRSADHGITWERLPRLPSS